MKTGLDIRALPPVRQLIVELGAVVRASAMMLIHECPRRDLSRIGVKRLRYCLPLKLKAEWFEDLKVRKVFGQQRSAGEYR